MRNLFLPLTAIVVAAILGGAAYMALKPQEAHLSPAMMNIGGAEIGGPFELTKHDGTRITSAELIDGPTLLYFGYTFCPDICPVDTLNMADATELLASKGIQLRPVFITVDPERDTAEALGYFVEGLHPRMVGLTGSPEEIDAAADAFKVFYQRVNIPDSAAGYLMNHTGYMYLMTPEKGLTALFRNGASAEQLAADIEILLGEI